MAVALITGSAGLIGSEAARHFAGLGLDVVGIDNDMRRYFFGDDGSTAWVAEALNRQLGRAYTHYYTDIRDRPGLAAVFGRYRSDIALVIHAAAQPSHDWAVKEPFTDFDVNAVGTLNVLEFTRRHCEQAPFIFRSRPGLTGVWQVSGRSLLPYRQRIKLDLAYAHECRLTTDLGILVRTIPTVLRGHGAY